MAGAVEALAMARPEAAGLDEVCRSQLGEVVSGLHRRGWAMAATFLVTLAGACGGDDYGIAVLTRSPVVDADTLTYRTQSPGSVERRGLVCALTSVGGRRTRVCSTHLVSHGEERSVDVGRGQVAEAAALTRSYRLPVVLMGDLNMSPDDVGTAALYSPAHGSSAGVFDEVDEGPDRCRCGAATHSGGAKLDYVFVTAHDFAVNGARALDVPSSDHDLLRGVVSLR